MWKSQPHQCVRAWWILSSTTPMKSNLDALNLHRLSLNINKCKTISFYRKRFPIRFSYRYWLYLGRMCIRSERPWGTFRRHLIFYSAHWLSCFKGVLASWSLLNIEPLSVRRKNACILFVFDIFTVRINSPKNTFIIGN